MYMLTNKTSSENGRIVQDEIRKFLAVLAGRDDVFEIRVLLGRGVVSGYYTLSCFDKLTRDLQTYAQHNIYVTLNQVNPALIARAHCKLRKYPEKTTSSTDIIKRRWLLVDIDPVRPSGICASESERQAASLAAREIQGFLSSCGWPDPVLVSSGNGYYLLYRVDLPNDDASTELVRSILSYLDLRFSTETVKVDDSVHNPDRLIRLAGTYNRKGDSTPDRPHRLCRIVCCPSTIEVVTEEKLRQIADLLPQPEEKFSKTAGKSKKRSGSPPTGRLRELLEQSGLEIKREKSFAGGTCYVLRVCPFDATHTDAAAYVIEFPNGAVAAGCHHASCLWGWKELKEKLLPYQREREDEDQQEGQNIKTPLEIKSRKESKKWKPALSAIACKTLEEVEWLWGKYIPSGKVCVMEGDPGVGKTWVALAIAATLTQQGHAVIYASGEDGASDTLLPRLMSMQADLEKFFLLEGKKLEGENEEGIVEHITLSDKAVLEEAIKSVGARLLVLDPIQAYLGANVDFHKANEVRSKLLTLLKIAERQHCAVLVVRHLSKNSSAPALYRGLGSVDLSAVARSIILVGQDSQGNRAIVQTKNSLDKLATPLGFEIFEGRFYWRGEVNVKPEDLLWHNEAEKSAVEEAEEFLRGVLSQGPVAATEIIKQAQAVGITRASLKRAKKKLRVISYRKGGKEGGKWYWSLPEPAPDEKGEKPEMGKGAQGAHIYLLSPFKNHQKAQQNQTLSKDFKEAHVSPFKKYEKGKDNNSLEGNLKGLKQDIYRDEPLNEPLNEHLNEPHAQNARLVPGLCKRCARLAFESGFYFCRGSTVGNGGKPLAAFTFSGIEEVKECQYFQEKSKGGEVWTERTSPYTTSNKN